LAANHHIRMISEGSFNTEDWGNDAENSAFCASIQNNSKINEIFLTQRGADSGTAHKQVNNELFLCWYDEYSWEGMMSLK